MAKCPKHNWTLMNMGNKTFVYCVQCGGKFPFTSDLNGAPYRGTVPEKYQNS